MLKFVMCILFSAASIGAAAPETTKEIIAPEPAPYSKPAEAKLDKAFICFRVGLNYSLPEEPFTALLNMFDKYKGVTDEITFFSCPFASPTPIEAYQKNIEILATRMKAAHEHGYKSGINILATIGHHEEGLENTLKGDYTNMTDIDGKVCRGSFCPNHENYQNYVRQLYTVTAQADPDYIWTDDDVRFAGHMPIGLTCFCDQCLAIFEKETGQKYTRETFKKAVNESPIEENLKLRKAWLQHNRDSIGRLFTTIENAVHAVRRGMSLGFMTGDRFAEGYDFDTWANILTGPNHCDVRWRPGGGFYNDSRPEELAGKSHDIGRQVSMLPDHVRNIQSEIENCPYQRLQKADNIVVLEAASHIAAGCTGAAFNVLGEPLPDFEPLFSRLHEARPFFDLMARTLGRKKIIGAAMFWNKDSYAAESIKTEWFGASNPLPKLEIYDIGLPTGYSYSIAPVVMLYGDCVYALSRPQIESLLSGGVYMDAAALKNLNAMGFGELTGFDVGEAFDRDSYEKFADHPVNGPLAGQSRDRMQAYWKQTVWGIRKTDPKALPLTVLMNYSGKTVADCTLGVFENRLGGRIAVAGYSPWTFLQSSAKMAQLKSLFRWLSKDTLPGYVASFNKINLWIRDGKDGSIALAMTNSSFDPAENLVLMLRTNEKNLTVYDMQCRSTAIQSAGTDGPYQKFVIPRIDPWQIRLITLK
jgi:hypothetical protein